MATVASARPRIPSPNPSHSSAASAKDSTSKSSLVSPPPGASQTSEGNADPPTRRESTTAPQQDGHLAPPQQVSSPTLSADSISTSPPAPTRRPTLTNRITRMFSTRGDSPNTTRDGSKNRDRASSNASSGYDESRNASASEAEGGLTRNTSKTGLHKGSRNDSAERSSSASTQGGVTKVESKEDTQRKARYVLHDDGTHEHNLKSEKRQEKLSGMLRNIFGGKKGEGAAEDHHLSLVSSWVDQVKNEKVAGDQKGGPNCANTLVEKYGKCHEVVGRGAFGIVRISHKADDKDPKKEQLYAVKEFRRRPSESPKKYNKRLTSEFCISSALRHPNIIHTLDLMKDAKGDFCEVMEYCAGGDLYSLVLAAGKLEVLEADCYFKQLMRGVEYIHDMGVAHRDLKPENLLLTSHGALKITDFGNGECFRMAWEKEPHMVAGLCGSAPYIAPEEYIDAEFDPRAVDVWACGVIYMAMRTGRHLWRVAKKDEDEFYERYLEGRRDEDGYGPIETLHRARCRNVVYSILDPNPSRRITTSQVLKSEWGREIKLCKAGEEGH